MELARRDPSVWEHSLEQFANQEMPPKDKPQPSPEQMGRLTAWMQDTLEAVARETAGDPGPVVLRRLSNMEYTYTVRDLTGVPSLDPAKEFPVDGAAGEGFTNAGAALVMSPSLLTKYFDAAKEIASHAVLLPKSFRFSAGDSPQDWTDELLTKIREFYGQVHHRRQCHGGESAGHQIRYQCRRADAGRQVHQGAVAGTRRAARRKQEHRCGGEGTWIECEVCGHPLGRSGRGPEIAGAGPSAQPVQHGLAGRPCESDRDDQRLAAIPVALHQRRSHWQEERTQGLAGTRESHGLAALDSTEAARPPKIAAT